MRHIARALLFATTLVLPAAPAAAGNWIFAQSYYSHAPIHRVEIGTPTSARSLAPRYFQTYTQGGYRFTGGSYNLRSNNFGAGRYFESWGSVGPHN